MTPGLVKLMAEASAKVSQLLLSRFYEQLYVKATISSFNYCSLL
jgi:hypothetical protein